jgi:error-prone DNA polymerase
MRVLEVAGYDLAEADRIRRHLDDGAEIGELENAFLEHAVACGLGSDDADTVWRELASFASFGFCKAHAAAFAVPTYQSSWLKAHYPAHFLAGVLTHEPGMYPRRLILEDAREHAIPILSLDVNHSQKPYTVEPVGEERVDPALRGGRFGELARSLSAGERLVAPSPPASPLPPRFELPRSRSPALESPRSGGNLPAAAFGIRIGLQDVHGISDAEIASILEARTERPFASVGDFLRRTRVSRPVVEALAHAGAFDAVGLDASASVTAPAAGRPPRSLTTGGGPVRPARRRAAAPGALGGRRPTRRDRLYVAMTAETQREGEQLCLPLDAAERAPGLREYTDPERVRAELEVTGMDWSRHLLSFYEALLGDLGVVRSGDLRRCRGDSRVMVAGVKVASQTPAVRSGQRIIFLTLDDATGPVDVTVFQRVQERCARTVFHGFLLAVWGRLRRTGVGGVSIAAEEVWDLQLLDAARREGRLLEMMRTPVGPSGASFQTLPDQTAPKKVWHSSGGSSGW